MNSIYEIVKRLRISYWTSVGILRIGSSLQSNFLPGTLDIKWILTGREGNMENCQPEKTNVDLGEAGQISTSGTNLQFPIGTILIQWYQ